MIKCPKYKAQVQHYYKMPKSAYTITLHLQTGHQGDKSHSKIQLAPTYQYRHKFHESCINWVLFVLDGVEIAPSAQLVEHQEAQEALVTQLLGVLIDETLSFDGHISHLTRNCYYQLRRIKAI